MGRGHNRKDKTMEETDGEIGCQTNSSFDDGDGQASGPGGGQAGGQLGGQPAETASGLNSHDVDNNQLRNAHALSVHLETDNLIESRWRTLHHSATSPHLRDRPQSANIPPVCGRILREIGDRYCYSPGIALRQMGDKLSADYEVRRALSTGDIPNAWKNSC